MCEMELKQGLGVANFLNRVYIVWPGKNQCVLVLSFILR